MKSSRIYIWHSKQDNNILRIFPEKAIIILSKFPENSGFFAFSNLKQPAVNHLRHGLDQYFGLLALDACEEKRQGLCIPGSHAGQLVEPMFISSSREICPTTSKRMVVYLRG